MSGIAEELTRNYENVDEYGRLALAFKRSAGENAFELLRRYKSTTERAYHRSLEALEKFATVFSQPIAVRYQLNKPRPGGHTRRM